MKRYYNAQIDVTVTINGENFSILGNREDEVTDETILNLADGVSVEGWERVQ